MKLKDFLLPEAGQIIKGFEEVRLEYEDRVRVNIKTPSFENWKLKSNLTRQSFGYLLVNEFICENDLIILDRKTQSPDECFSILTNKQIMENNNDILEESRWTVGMNSDLIRITTDDIPGMLLGNFFSTWVDKTAAVADNFSGKLFAKIIVGDKIGWMCFTLLSNEYDLEVE